MKQDTMRALVNSSLVYLSETLQTLNLEYSDENTELLQKMNANLNEVIKLSDKLTANKG